MKNLLNILFITSSENVVLHFLQRYFGWRIPSKDTDVIN